MYYYPLPMSDFSVLRTRLAEDLLQTPPIHPMKWQQLDVSGSPGHATHELLHVTLGLDMVPLSMGELQHNVKPDLPWAEDHFQERVGGVAVNPGSTHHYWPYHGASAQLHLRGSEGSNQIYDHNYMERFWPKWAGEGWRDGEPPTLDPRGYRFPIGDLMDLVFLLQEEPTTRQAYLPVWFPEDTGVVMHQRVPCTLGYHFIIRDGLLHCSYYLRSCEIYRHFTNDVYLAARLMQWVAEEVTEIQPGSLLMHITSLHGFVGDTAKIRAL